MKKLAIILIGATLSTGAYAQTQKAEEKQLQNDIRTEKQQKKEVANDVVNGNLKEAKKDNQKVMATTKRTQKHAKHLKRQHGVKHPVVKAKEEIREQNQATEAK